MHRELGGFKMNKKAKMTLIGLVVLGVTMLVLNRIERVREYRSEADQMAVADCQMTVEVVEPSLAPTTVPSQAPVPSVVLSPTAAEIPVLRCDSLSLAETAGVGETVTVNWSASPKGVVRFAKVVNVGDRCADFDCQTLEEGRFIANEPGLWVFEVNVYSNDCQYLCSAGANLYQNLEKDCQSPRSSWTAIASCFNNQSDPNCHKCQNSVHCLKYLRVD